MWSLPSKLTAIGALVGVLSFCAYLIEKGYPIFIGGWSAQSINDVHLVVEFENQVDETIYLYGRGETFFWFPGGGEHKIYAFEIINTSNSESNSSNIVVPKKSKIRYVVKLLPANVARHYLEQGHMSISLYFRGVNGRNKFSPTVGFSRSNIERAYIPIKFDENKS